MKKYAALLAWIAAGSVNAGVISSKAALVLETTDIDQTLNLDQFDSKLGTLTAVDITLFGQGVSSASVTNTAAQTQVFRFSSVLDLLFSGPAIGDTVSIPLFDTNGFISIDTESTLDLGSVDESAQRVLSVGAADFGAFVGSGKFNLGCVSFVSNATGGGGGNVRVEQSTQAGCGASVAYTYDASAVQPQPPAAVSEPGSMALTGLGLFGIAAWRRRR